MKTRRYAKEAPAKRSLLDKLGVEVLDSSSFAPVERDDALEARIYRTLDRKIIGIEHTFPTVSAALTEHLATPVGVYATGKNDRPLFVVSCPYSHAVPLVSRTQDCDGEAGLLFQGDPRKLSAEGTRYLSAATPDLVRVLRNGLKYALEHSRSSELEEETLIDERTGILNNKGLRKFITHELALLQRSERKGPESHGLALLVMDIDRFKAINDSYGHPSGDRYIRLLAQTLSEGRRETDHEGRWGGDEHVVALPNCPPHVAVRIANDIRQRFFRYTSKFDGSLPPRTISVGIAHTSELMHEYRYPDKEDRLRDGYSNLFLLADARLYAAKDFGRDRVEDIIILRNDAAGYRRILTMLKPEIAGFIEEINTGK